MKKLLILAIVPILACKCRPNDPPPPNDTQKPVCSINVDASSVSTTSATVNFSASDNVTVINTTLTLNGGAPIGVTGQTVYSFIGLTPNTGYTATLTAKDAAGNVGTASASFTTLALPPQNSSWFAQPTVTYSSPVSGMIGNTVSNEFNIALSNTSATAKTATFSLSFGANGSTVKMLRYQAANAPDGTGWTVIPASAGTGTFSNFTLQPGTTTLKARFALKENVGVANGSSLSISFSSLSDGEGGVLPIGGSWQAPVAAGTVDAVTQATKFTTEWLGYMSQSPLFMPLGGTGTSDNYNVTAVKVSGPGNARVASIKAKNPYGSLITFDNASWLTNVDGTGYAISQSNIAWSSDYVKITMPAQALISNSVSSNFFLRCGVSNPGPDFNSGMITPGLYGLELKSKYDLEILNSNGQIIDLSDVTVRQGANVVQN